MTNALDKKMARLTSELREQMKESAKLDKELWKNLEGIDTDLLISLREEVGLTGA